MQRPNRIADDEAIASTLVFVLDFVRISCYVSGRVFGCISGRVSVRVFVRRMSQYGTLQLRTLQHHSYAQTFLTGRFQRKSIIGTKQRK